MTRLVLTALITCLLAGQAFAETSSNPTITGGVTDGAFSVDGNGGATYSIPIEVPPGTNGVAPKLSLVYQSQKHNCIMGMGFTLSGVSSITRCPRTMAQDGVRGRVAFDSGDRFCMDGARLMAIQGSYGADGTIYHTERESWAKIVSHEQCGSGPCFFTVTTKKGIEQSYGGTADSRIEAQGKSSVLIWALDKTTDLNGNYVKYTYDEEPSNSTYRVDTISYTGNGNTGLAPQRSVTFDYEDRTDKPVRYIGGSKVQDTKRLSSIQTSVGAGAVKAYNLSYEYGSATGTSLLRSIQECGDENTCFSPTTFAWDSSGSDPFASAKWSGSWPSTSEKYHLADFNGDGLSDILVIPVGGGYQFYLSDGSSDPFASVTWSGNWPSTGEKYHLADFDGNGITDILVIPAGGGYKFYLSDGSSDPFASATWSGSWPSTSEQYHLADFDGNGITDILVIPAGGGYKFYLSDGTSDPFASEKWSGSWPSTGEQYHLADFDGNGITDILVIPAGGGYKFYSSDGTSDPFASEKWSGSWPSTSEQYHLADYNGDGLSDILVIPAGGGYKFYLSDGSSDPFAAEMWSGSWPSTGEKYHLADFDGNGMTDILVIPAGGGYRFYLSNGTSDPFASATWSGGWPSTSEQYHLADFNGDGLSDILVIPVGGGHKFYINPYQSPARMTEVTNGIGGYTKATYRPITDSSIYTKGSGATFPIVDVQNAFFVVSQHTNGDGRLDNNDGSHSYTFNHTYAGAQVDRNGRGWLGFETVNLIDLGSGLTTTTTHNMVFPKSGGIKGAEVRDTANGALLQTTANTYTQSNPHPRVYQVTRSKETTTWYSKGTSAYALEKSFAYDAFGNLTTVTDSGDTAAGDPVVYTCTQYFNAATGGFWRLGYPTDVKISADKADCQDFQAWHAGSDASWARFTYDTNGNLSTDSDYLYDSATQTGSWITTAHTPDAYGNVIGVTDPRGNTEVTVYEATYHSFPTKVISPPPQGLTWEKTACAMESGTCTFDGTRLVKYGAGQLWYYRLAKDSISCSNTLYGDPAFGQFKSCYASTTDPTQGAVIEQAAYDPKFGAQISNTDPNGNVTTATIDGFGRPKDRYGPNPSGKQVLVETTEYGGGADAGWMYVATFAWTKWDDDKQANWYNENDHIDGMGRTFRVVSTSTSRTNDDLFLSETFFDNAGRVWKEAVQYYASETPTYVTRTYTPQDLPASVTQPDSAQMTLTYDFQSLGVQHADKKVTRTAPSPENSATGTQTVSTQDFLNSRGQVVQRVAADGGTTSYTHDILGEVLTKTDPLGVVTTYTYDSLSRLLTVSMPSRGTTTYTYDANGNVLTSTDAKGQVLTFTYDTLNRPLSKDVASAGGATVSNSAYTYDDPSQSNNKGRLSSVSKFQGDTTVSNQEVVSSTFAYDAYGNITTKTITFGAAINDAATQSAFAENSTYQPTGNLDSYTYPDGSVLSQTYTPEGFLSTISLQANGSGGLQPKKTYVTYSDYNALGQAQTVAYGNGVTSTYSFDDIGRRQTSKTFTGPATAPTTTFLDYAYTWNQANKLLEIQDNVHARRSQSFTYTAAGRLKTAQGAYPTITYAYDHNGNITSKNIKSKIAVSYGYGATNKNQLVTIGTSSSPNVTYDLNGNMLTRPRSGDGSGALKQYVYDPENNLTEAYGHKTHSLGSLADYSAYDDEGERLKKTILTLPSTVLSVTWYVSPQYDITEANGLTLYTKYLYGPGGLVASIATSESLRKQAKAAGHTMMAGMLNGDSIPALWRKAYHRFQAFMAGPTASPGGMVGRVGAVLLALVLVPLLFVRFGRERPRLETRGRAWRRILRQFTTGLVIVAFFFTNVVSTAYADLTAGPNGTGIPVAGTAYFHQDNNFSTTLVTDDNAAEVTRIAYDPYGDIYEGSSSGSDQSRSKYGGRELDLEVYIYYFGARFYDPDLGRFLSPDPDWQYNSPYVSDDADPLDYYDPDGMLAGLIAAIVIGAIIGAYSGGAAVNHDFNPAHWDWKSGKTWGGVLGGAAIGGLGGAAGAGIAGAGLGTAGTLAATGVLGGVESVAFTAMSGADGKELGISFAQGFAFGVLFAGASNAVGKAFRSAAGQALKRSLNAGLKQVSKRASQVPKSMPRALSKSSLCRASFTKGTSVAGEDGSKPIEEIAFGDEVWSYNAEDGKAELKPVSGLFTRIAAGVVLLTLGTTTVEATPAHPFYVPAEDAWVAAADLDVGVEVKDRNGNLVGVTAHKAHKGPVRVFNLEVAENHNYFAGDASVLVHNCNRPGWRKATIKRAWAKARKAAMNAQKRVCPTCKKLVGKTRINSAGNKVRGYDIDHTGATWAARMKRIKSFTGKGKWTRKQIIDEYQRSVRLQCKTCNRSNLHNPDPAEEAKYLKKLKKN